MTGSRAALMMVQDRSSGNLFQLLEHGIPLEPKANYAEHYVHNDPRIAYAVQNWQKRTVCDYDFITESQMGRHEYYAEFLTGCDFRYSGAVHLTELEAEGELRAISVQRSPREGHPTSAQLELLERLAPHIAQAARLEKKLTIHTLQESLFEGLLNFLDAGMLVCDAAADVVWQNEAADSYIGNNKSLQLYRGCLYASSPALTRELREALGGACRAFRGDSNPGRAMRLPSDKSGQSTDLLVCPLPAAKLFTTMLMPRTKHYALIVLRRYPAKTLVTVMVLQQLYGLSPSEARLTADLVAGYSTAEIAKRMRVTRETLRSYLKQVFVKTVACRQAELIGLVLNSPAIFDRGLICK